MAKKAKEDAETKLGEVRGECERAIREAEEVRQRLAARDREVEAFEAQKRMFQETLESMGKLNGQLKEEMAIHKGNAERLKALQKLLLDSLATVKHHSDQVSATLSCLSCLKFLKCGPGTNSPMPLTLLCGHSICAKCFKEHSDPKSPESLVFCEECKIETKNKSLRESKVIGDICSGFGKMIKTLDSLREGSGALSNAKATAK
jgi:hypothetical protein